MDKDNLYKLLTGVGLLVLSLICALIGHFVLPEIVAWFYIIAAASGVGGGIICTMMIGLWIDS